MNLEDYERIETQVQDVRFGVINIYMHREDNEDLIMEKTRTSISQEDHDFNHLQAEQRMCIDHPSVLKMICCSRLDEDWETKAYFEYPNEDLYDRRASLTSPAEIMKFLTHLLEALVYLQDNRFVHGDIRPEYIFYNARKNRYILLDRLGDPSSYSQAQRNNLVYENKNIFMSPKMFHSLSRGHGKVHHNPFKSEVFSLGMVMLSMFTDDVDLGMCFNRFSKQFDELHFKSIFVDLNKHFFSGKIERLISDFLFDSMLNLDENSRLSPRKCLQKLRFEVAPAMLRELERHQMELRMKQEKANQDFEEALQQEETKENGGGSENVEETKEESGSGGLELDLENEGFEESHFFDTGGKGEVNLESKEGSGESGEGNQETESFFDKESEVNDMFQSKVEIDNSSRQMREVDELSQKTGEESFDLTTNEKINGHHFEGNLELGLNQ
jgi:serine/threonine protein kinase